MENSIQCPALALLIVVPALSLHWLDAILPAAASTQAQ
jgi:hypothetical protein